MTRYLVLIGAVAALCLPGVARVVAQEEAEESEAAIAIDALPEAVRDAINAAYPGCTLVEAVRETEGDRTVYEVLVRNGEESLEVEVTADGEIVEVESADEDDGGEGEDDEDDDGKGD